MKITVDDCFNIEISDFKKKIIFDLVNKNEFFEIVVSGIDGFVKQLYRSALINLRNTWAEKMNLPADDKGMCTMIFSHPDYLDKRDRELEAQADATSKFSVN